MFIELASCHHLTIKFVAEILVTEITFNDTCICKGNRRKKEAIFKVCTHFKPT